jgi:MFS family permease
MVGKEDLMNAIALNSSMFNGARIVGPAISGILVARIGEGWCFLANSVSYIAVIAGLFLMRVNRPSRLAPSGPALARLIERIPFARDTAPFAPSCLLRVWSVWWRCLLRSHALFADRVLHGVSRAGILMGATGVGALLERYPGHPRRRARSGQLGRVLLRRLWHQPGAVFPFA